MLTPLFFGDQKLTHDAICMFVHQVRWWILHFKFIWKLKRIIKIQNLNGDDRTMNRGWDLSGHSSAVLNCVKFRVRSNRKKAGCWIRNCLFWFESPRPSKRPNFDLWYWTTDTQPVTLSNKLYTQTRTLSSVRYVHIKCKVHIHQDREEDRSFSFELSLLVCVRANWCDWNFVTTQLLKL